ncbi:MAG: TIM barrel protein [Clostridiales bacterium]|nr:TIM barrel protein [Clostridiales bacterium]
MNGTKYQIKRSCCIDPMYGEIPFTERFAAAARDGFDAVEFWEWRDKDLDRARDEAEKNGLVITGFNGDADYSLIDPDTKKEYLRDLRRSVEAAKRIGARSVTIHSNALGEGGKVLHDYRELTDTVKLCTMFSLLTECAKIAEDSGIRMNLEPLNIRVDHVGNYLVHTDTAADLTRLIGSPMLKVLYDAYHMQLNEGDLIRTIERNFDQIAHIHVADVPGRHEPGTGEINYSAVYRKLTELGYTGYVGYELFPLSTTDEAVRRIFAE